MDTSQPVNNRKRCPKCKRTVHYRRRSGDYACDRCTWTGKEEELV